MERINNRIIKPRFEWHPRINPHHPLAQGLVGYWAINEGGGLYVFDSTLRNPKGTIDGATWVPEVPGISLILNGSTDLINLGNNNPLNLTGDLTLYICCRPLTPSSVYKSLLGKEVWAIPNGKGYYLGYNPGNANDIYFGFNTGGNEISTNNDCLSYNAIHDVVGTFNSTLASNNLKIYVDGILQGQGGTSTCPIGHTNNAYIGYVFTSGNIYTNMVAFRAGIYNRVLRPEEIQWLYTEPYAIFEQPRMAKWFVSEAVGGLSIPVAMDYYRQRRV